MARGGVGIALTYKNINRAGSAHECGFENNDKSEMLCCFRSSYDFYCDSVHSPVSGPQSSTVGVHLDHSTGILSFYSVSATMTLLHRHQTISDLYLMFILQSMEIDISHLFDSGLIIQFL